MYSLLKDCPFQSIKYTKRAVGCSPLFLERGEPRLGVAGGELIKGGELTAVGG